MSFSQAIQAGFQFLACCCRRDCPPCPPNPDFPPQPGWHVNNGGNRQRCPQCPGCPPCPNNALWRGYPAGGIVIPGCPQCPDCPPCPEYPGRYGYPYGGTPIPGCPRCPDHLCPVCEGFLTRRGYPYAAPALPGCLRCPAPACPCPGGACGACGECTPKDWTLVVDSNILCPCTKMSVAGDPTWYARGMGDTNGTVCAGMPIPTEACTWIADVPAWTESFENAFDCSGAPSHTSNACKILLQIIGADLVCSIYAEGGGGPPYPIYFFYGRTPLIDCRTAHVIGNCTGCGLDDGSCVAFQQWMLGSGGTVLAIPCCL